MHKLKTFQGKDIKTYWLPLVQHMIDCHHLAYAKFPNNDEMYVKYWATLMSKYYQWIMLSRLTGVFMYVLEFVYGDPYKEKGNEPQMIAVSTEEYFEQMVRHWNTDIAAEVNKAKSKTKSKTKTK